VDKGIPDDNLWTMSDQAGPQESRRNICMIDAWGVPPHPEITLVFKLG
jgi:hypothetical protein